MCVGGVRMRMCARKHDPRTRPVQFRSASARISSLERAAEDTATSVASLHQSVTRVMRAQARGDDGGGSSEEERGGEDEGAKYGGRGR